MKISFVIPAFNCAAWLPHSIKSVLLQTYPEWELLVVDDASTDSTGEYLDWLATQDKRIRILRNAENKGRSYSRNMGNSEATGDIIAVLDADDVASPKRAKLSVDKIRQGCDFVYGSAEVMGPLGDKRGLIQADVFKLDRSLKEMENRIVHSTVAVRREIALKFPYREGEAARLGLDDWAFCLDVAMAGYSLDFIPQPICGYRVLGTSITSTRNQGDVLKFKNKHLDKIRVWVPS